MSYYIKWDDGDITDWTSYQASGEAFYDNHTWSTKRKYTIEAKSKDTYGVESDWTKYTVTMPRDKAKNIYLLDMLFNHPNIFPFLQILLKFLGL